MNRKSIEILTALSIAITTMIGCGGAPPPQTVQSACYALCDAESKATGCSNPASSDGDCKRLCDSIIPTLSADCQAKAKTAWSCQASLQWSCMPGSNTPTASGCDTESQALDQCFNGGDGGTH
jgi:hypothetical protein